jgi:hypothetical protein
MWFVMLGTGHFLRWVVFGGVVCDAGDGTFLGTSRPQKHLRNWSGNAGCGRCLSSLFLFW